MSDITARPRLLSVTESIALPPRPAGGPMCDTEKFDFREWMVPQRSCSARSPLRSFFNGDPSLNRPAAAKSARMADRRRHGKYSDHQERKRTSRDIRRIKDGSGRCPLCFYQSRQRRAPHAMGRMGRASRLDRSSSCTVSQGLIAPRDRPRFCPVSVRSATAGRLS
jgi:hypothetical protein